MRARIMSATLALFMVVMLSPTVHPAWIADGIPVCLPIGQQSDPDIAPDGAGGAFIVWSDSRAPVNTDIYVQHVDADGNILLIDTGIPVCTAAGLQSKPLIVPDGAGGAIVAWQDYRSGSTNDIYAQKIDSYGFGQWTGNGVAICTGKTGLALCAVIPDGAGGAIVAWHDRRNFTNDVFAQRIGAGGSVMWETNGITVVSADGNQQNPSLASDGAGGAIIAWEDARVLPNDIYAQRIDGAGAVRWTANGVAVCTASYTQILPQVIPDGIGGAIVAWSDYRNGNFFGVFAQRLSPSGSACWTPDGMAISYGLYDRCYCQIVPVGSGEAILMWEDQRSAVDSDIYAQKIDTTGAAHWAANGIAVCAAADYQTDVRLVSDNAGGAVATWEDLREGATDADIYAQRVYSDGGIHWTADGVAVCAAANSQAGPRIATDGWSGAIITWRDPRSGTSYVYCQRVDGAGNTVVATLLQAFCAAWSDTGIRIEWTLSEMDENVEFIVSRAAGAPEDFTRIPSERITNDGLSFSFVDTDCELGTTYYYRVEIVSGSGRLFLFETDAVETPPAELTLHQNYPNPFNPSTTIRYRVPGRCRVTLEVYRVSGDLVSRLYDGYREKGIYSASWNGRDSKGVEMGSGIYLYRLKAGKETLTRKMLLLR